MSHQARETEEGQKRGKSICGRETHSAKVFVGRDDDVIAELGRMEQPACEAGDEGESEPAEKDEQISESPSHLGIITSTYRIRNSEFGIRNRQRPRAWGSKLVAW